MRRIDVWVGRLVAVAGLLYVALASLWPLTVSGALPSVDESGFVAGSVARTESFAGVLPFGAPRGDLRLARVIADVTATREQRRQARRAAEMPVIDTTSNALAMLLIATCMLGAAVAAIALSSIVRRRSITTSASAPIRRHGTKCWSSAPCGGSLIAIALNVPDIATVPA